MSEEDKDRREAATERKRGEEEPQASNEEERPAPTSGREPADQQDEKSEAKEDGPEEAITVDLKPPDNHDKIIRVPDNTRLPEGYEPREGDVRISLKDFEGPLDLLLYLIRKHKMDIFDIPIAEITERYLNYLDAMPQINVDVAGDLIAMAATLIHIKSRMMLPREDDDDLEDEEGGDPREELVRRLLEYQKYKEAAEQLHQRPWLGRDVYDRPMAVDEIPKQEDGEEMIEEVGVYALIEAFQKVMSRVKFDSSHTVQLDEVKVEEQMSTIRNRLRMESRFTFTSLFTEKVTHAKMVATLLAILELARLKLLGIYQADEGGEIYLSSKGDVEDDDLWPDDPLDYQ